MLNTDKKITRSGWWNFSRKNIVAVLNQVSQRKEVRVSYVKEKFSLMDSATSYNFFVSVQDFWNVFYFAKIIRKTS